MHLPRRRSGPTARRPRDRSVTAGRRPASGPPGRSRPSTRDGRTHRARQHGEGDQEERPVRTSRLTSRAAILGLVVCAIVLTLAYPTRQYLAQRSQIGQLRADNADKQHRVVDLQQQQVRWNDPAYVRAQARERLQYVLPGQVLYVIVDPNKAAAQRNQRSTAPVRPAQSARDQPWYSQLWGTTRAADGS